MISKQTVAVVVPVYNEADHLSVFLDRLKAQGVYILVVDDGSEDRSFEIASSKGVATLRLVKNQGKGSALRAGFEKLKPMNFDWIFMMDSDGQHLPEEMVVFMDRGSKGDVGLVNGNRLHDPKGMPLIRLATNRVMSWLVSLAAKQHILDSQCGYKLISMKALRDISLKSKHFEIEDEILLEVSAKGYQIACVPVTTSYGKEESHVDPVRDTVRFIRFMLRRICK